MFRSHLGDVEVCPWFEVDGQFGSGRHWHEHCSGDRVASVGCAQEWESTTLVSGWQHMLEEVAKLHVGIVCTQTHTCTCTDMRAHTTHSYSQYSLVAGGTTAGLAMASLIFS